jgi:Bacterial Ig-like domain
MGGLKDIIIQNKALIKESKNDSNKYIMFALVIFGLFIIFSYGLGNVSAASVSTVNTNGSPGDNSGAAAALGSSNIVNQNINEVKLNITRPKVNSTDPALNAVNVPTNKTINITFTEPIKLGSNPWIEFKNASGAAVPFTATVNGNVLFISHNSLLACGERYNIILHSNSITDLSGIGILLCSTNFTTIKQPVIISSNPINNAVNVPTKKVIQINFNRAVKYGNISGIQFIDSKGTAIPFTSTITGSTLNITPTLLLSHGTQYTIILHSNSIKDLSGNGLIVCSTKFTTIVTTKSISVYGVTFNYPATWVTQQDVQDGADLIFAMNPNEFGPNAPQVNMQIMSNPAGMSDAEALGLIKDSPFPSGFKVLAKKMITFNGTPAFETVFTINNKQMYPGIMQTLEIDIVKNHKTYSLDFIAPIKEFNSAKTTFDIIINSFRIS